MTRSMIAGSSLAMSERSEFYVYLLSNASMNVHPGNTLSHFTVVLDRPLWLSDDYEVGLQELCFPNSFYNVTDAPKDNIITVFRRGTRVESKTFHVKRNFETAMQNVLVDLNIAVKYDGKCYLFGLHDNVQRLKFLDKELQEWMGATAIKQSVSYGAPVPRENVNVDLTEEATAICLQKRAPGEGLASYAVTSNTKSLKKTLEEFFMKTSTPSKIEYGNNKYRLMVSSGFALPSHFVTAINGVSIKEEGKIKHVIYETITKKYRSLLEKSEISSYNAYIPPNFYDTPTALRNAINKEL